MGAEWAERRCLDTGLWEGPPETDVSDAAAAAVALQNDEDVQQGWTNYSQCYLPEIRDLMNTLDEGDAEVIHLSLFRFLLLQLSYVIYKREKEAKGPREFWMDYQRKFADASRIE